MSTNSSVSESESTVSPPSWDEINSEHNPTRKTILIAMRSLLIGDPQPKPANLGKRSINALANEAGIGRDRLVRGAFMDLKQRFESVVAVQNQAQTPQEHVLHSRIEKLTERTVTAERRYKDARAEREQMRHIIQALSQQLQRSIQERVRLEGRLKRAEKQLATAGNQTPDAVLSLVSGSGQSPQQPNIH